MNILSSVFHPAVTSPSVYFCYCMGAWYRGVMVSVRGVPARRHEEPDARRWKRTGGMVPRSSTVLPHSWVRMVQGWCGGVAEMERRRWIWVLAAMLIIWGWTMGAGAEERAPDALYPVLVDGKFGFADVQGTLVIPAQFDGARNFVEGRACVARGKRWGYIDTAGRLVIPTKYEWAFDFAQGTARVGSGLKSAYVDHSGKPVWPQAARVAEGFEGFSPEAVSPSAPRAPRIAPMAAAR